MSTPPLLSPKTTHKQTQLKLEKHHSLPLFILLATAVLLFPVRGTAGGFLSPGDLAQDHEELEGLTQCSQCHKPFSPGVDAKRCIACHNEIQSQIQADHGFHARRTTQCERCHSDHHGRDFELTQFNEELFGHRSTGFPLEGEHEAIECRDCHTDEDSWQGLDPECQSCHQDEDPHGTEMSERSLLQECDSCHQTVDWSALPILASIFDHTSSRDVDYPLVGKHTEVECIDCHNDWTFVPTEHELCLDCHQDPHHTEFNQACEQCHATPASWRVPSFDHSRTSFPLEGLHQETRCSKCHFGHASIPRDHGLCADCHDTPHGDQFDPSDCADCHTLTEAHFEILDFDHDATNYPLTGSHSSVECGKCHIEAEPTVYADLPADDCSDCHEDVHNAQFEPTACSDCHSTPSWVVEDFDHRLTDFPLEGEHQDTPCVDCHGDHSDEPTSASGEPLGQSSLFSSLASFELEFGSCLSCHEEENPHDETISADSCEDCHTAASWEVDSYDHEPNFTLGKAHEEAACVACHSESLEHFDGLEGECISCHQKDRLPGHYSDQECDGCHKAALWLPASLGSYDHSVTGFRLLHAHARLDCSDCHEHDPPFGRVPADCAGCHSDDDVHRNLLGDACDDCHTPTRWTRSTWRHHLVGWPLRGGHKLAACDDCHATGYAGTPTECWRCHENEARPQIPAHTGAFGRDCDACHRPYNWSATYRFSQ